MSSKAAGKTLGLVFKTRIPVIAFFFAASYALWIVTEDYAIRNYVSVLPALVAVQIFLNDFLHLYLAYEVDVGRRWFSLLIAPGTILHELSHLFSAVLTGCYVTDVSLFKYNPRSGLLGYVGYTQPKDKWIVLRNLIVGFAPFFGCGTILIALSYFMSGGQLPDLNAVHVDSYASIYTVFYGLGLDYLGKIILYVIPNPLLWIILYLQFCFALGSASSTQDIKIFLTSLVKHPVSTVFILLLSYCLLIVSESTSEIYGVSPQDVVLTLLASAILILAYSITVLACSIPLAYVGDKFVEIKFSERFVTVMASVLVYLVSSVAIGLSTGKSVALALLAFASLIFYFKKQHLFHA
ncbi:MAG: hypothetical protein ABH834_03555 [Candidatus Altiarchaeota archaeon]